MRLSAAIGTLAAIGALASTARADAPVVQPGEWEIAVTVDAMDMEGAPGAVANLLVGKTATSQTCLSQKDAEAGPKKLLESSKECVFDRYAMANGRLSGEIVCRKGDRAMRILTEGRYTPTSFEVTGKATVVGQGAMKMESTSVGRRTGDCKE